VLGLTLDGSRLEGVVLRRTNGSLQLHQTFSVALTLDPLTAAPELVGREIRNQLDGAGVRERRCVVGVPLKWVLTAHTELPPLPEADAASLLQLEAERGFPRCRDAATGGVRAARWPRVKTCDAGGHSQRAHLSALEHVLAAAKLKPVGFSRSASRRCNRRGGCLQRRARAGDRRKPGVACKSPAAAWRPCARSKARSKIPGWPARLYADLVARESRITLGQLPAELRDAVKRIRIFGPRELAQQLADEMELRFEPMGLKVEIVSRYAPDEFGVELPPEAPVSAAFSLAARRLTGGAPVFEFLPPKPSALQQLVARYSSGRLRSAGAVAAGVLVLVGSLFLFQQFELILLRSRWSAMSVRVQELNGLQQQIQQYSPWFDSSFRNLTILRELTLAFPEDGSVTAKTVEIRDGNTVTCTGTAQDNGALRRTLNQLRTADGVTDVKLQQLRGQSPMQFSFDIHYGNGGGNEN
jgi:hypothetical protein